MFTNHRQLILNFYMVGVAEHGCIFLYPCFWEHLWNIWAAQLDICIHSWMLDHWWTVLTTKWLYFETQNFDILEITEPWLVLYILANAVSIQGYSIVREDRKDRRDGGVALYIKVGIKFSSCNSLHYLPDNLDWPIYKMLE